MKFLSNISVILACLATSLSAVETQRYGFLNVVNMIPSATSCEINLAGKTLVPDGLKSAKETGWFLVPIGSHKITIDHADHKKFSSNIAITEGVSNLLVIHLHVSERLSANGKPLPPQIRFATVGAYESTGFALKAMSMIPETNRFQLARETIELEFLKPTDVPRWTGGGFQIKHHNQIIGEVTRGRERASYLLLLSTDHQEKNLTTIVNADPQKLPPWMQN